jgi:TonB-dependent starch-binding outer membrane protein SusC
MRGKVIGSGGVLIAAVGLAVGGAACASRAPAEYRWPVGEPVPIAYATVTRGMATGAVASLAGDGVREVHAARIEDLLTRFSGVSVARLADGRVSVRIRGPHTLLGNAEPLLVIDGVPVEGDTGGLLRGINPADVVRIEVLKDGASTAIFGSRGGAGVIMITTRRSR